MGTTIRLAAAALAIVVSGPVTPAQEGGVFLGAVGREGLLLPVAAFDGTEWWNRWPFSYEADRSVLDLDVPDSLAGIPPEWLPPGVSLPREWRLLRFEGPPATFRIVRPARPTRFDFASWIGLTTTLEPLPEILGNVAVASEVGLAVAGEATLGAVVELAPESAESQSIFERLAPRLLQMEADAIPEHIRFMKESYDIDTFLDASAEQRAAQPHGSVTRAAELGDGPTMYYLTAFKSYRAGQPACDSNTRIPIDYVSFSGIVVESADDRLSLRHFAVGPWHDCEVTTGSATPLATVRINEQTFWVVRHDAEDGYNLAIWDPLSGDDTPSVWLRGRWGYGSR